jgi:hypothetical protein
MLSLLVSQTMTEGIGWAGDGIPELYSDPATLLEREKPDIVIVATPPDQHRDLCILALDSGAHVFCEKPFVKSLAEADEVIETAERRRRSVFVNNQYRFMKIYRVAQERIASGEYGKPFLIQCWQQMFHPPSEETNWRSRLVQSTLYEFGTHPLDLICFFFNDFPLSINAHTPRSCPAIEADVIVSQQRFVFRRWVMTLIFNRISHAQNDTWRCVLIVSKPHYAFPLAAWHGCTDWSRLWADLPSVQSGLAVRNPS